MSSLHIADKIKKKHLYNNTTISYPTYFPAAVDLIQKAREEYGFCSENWAYSTGMTYGFPRDYYYAEIWHDGMDWNSIYWLIEACKLSAPKIYPMIFFGNNDERHKYNEIDFKDLCQAIMYYRREKLWIQSDDLYGVYSDTVWPYISVVEPLKSLKENKGYMIKYSCCHGSQEKCEFYLNTDLIS